MDKGSSKLHWNKVYKTKSSNQMSWTQDSPQTALNYLEELNLPKSSNIIDIGGGHSKFVDHLLKMGYKNIWVLDISEIALEKARIRLKEKAELVHWIPSDILAYQPKVKFDFWYDRAVFHFLTEENDINKYVELVQRSINSGGHFLLGTFSENGPERCSGLEITRYSESSMINKFNNDFQLIKCFKENHMTPFDSVQEFQFCGFRKM